MKKIALNGHRLIVGLCLLATAAYSNTVLAHEMEGGLNTSAGEGATDLYSVSCYNDAEGSQQPTHQLFVNIRDNVKGGAVLSVLVYKKTATGAITKTATDPVGGDYTPSPDIILPGGEGEYLVFVNHTLKIAESYLLQFHCQDEANQHTGTQVQTLQNE